MSLVVFVRLIEEDFTGRNRGPGAILARGTASRRRGAEFHVNKRLAQTIAKTKMLESSVEILHRVIVVDLIWDLAQFDMQDLHAETDGTVFEIQTEVSVQVRLRDR